MIRLSEQIDKLGPALFAMQNALEPVKKEHSNSYFGSKYADLASVLDALREPLKSSGLVLLQGPAYALDSTVTVETTLLHAESGQWARNALSLRVPKDDPQGIGSAITYARRYSVQAMCAIAPEDDDGNAASGNSGGTASAAAREYKLKAPATDQPPAAVPLSYEVITGIVASVEKHKTESLWFIQIGDIKTWTKELALADASLALRGEEAKASVSRNPATGKYRLTSLELP